MKNSTYKRGNQTVSTVKKSGGQDLVGLLVQELLPGGPGSKRRRR